MELVGYLAAALIGTSLGLIGAGGSILTVPLLVYFFDVPVLLASSYSLAIVGCTSLLGAAIKYRQGHVHIKTALVFGGLSITVVSLVRCFVIPAIPHELFSVHGFVIESPVLSMVLFSLLMVLTSLGMIEKKKCLSEDQSVKVVPVATLLLTSVAVGLVTGLLGAGGGFLLVPALVLLFNLPMKDAVGTSLLIIALNSLTGFAMDLHHFKIDWPMLSTIAGISGVGIFAGVSLGKKISAPALRSTFGWVVLLVGIAVLSRELLSFVAKNVTHPMMNIHQNLKTKNI